MAYQAATSAIVSSRSSAFFQYGIRLKSESLRLHFLNNAHGIRSYSRYAQCHYNYSHPTVEQKSIFRIGFQRIGSIHQQLAITNHGRCFSTKEESSFSPINWWRGRQEKKEAEKYKDRIAKMANTEIFTIGYMLSDLDEAVKSWTAKLVSNKETATVKQMHKTLTGIVSVVGHDADQDRLLDMTRKEKLEAAVKGEATVEEINMLINQFQSMTLMHRVIRSRHLQGKQIPETAEAMQAVILAESPKFLSKEKKKELAKKQAKLMMRRR